MLSSVCIPLSGGRTLATIAALALAACAQASAQATGAAAPDTVRLSLDSLEARFAARNLPLLAARLDIATARAQVTQARLLPNPTLGIEQSAVTPGSSRLFDVTRTGNTELDLQQVVQLAGKRRRQVALASAGVTQAEFTRAELARDLRFELRSDAVELAYLGDALAFDDSLAASVGETVALAERLAERKDILLADVARLRALQLGITVERTGFALRESELQRSLGVLLGDDVPHRYVIPLDTARIAHLDPAALVPAQEVEALAVRRSDVQLADAGRRVAEASLALQRAARTPNLVLGGHYSRQGSFVPEYNALTIGIDLPLFNRNQGAIEGARTAALSAARQADQARLVAQRELLAAREGALLLDGTWRANDPRLLRQFAALSAGMTAMYRRHDVSVLQYADFIDSYRQSLQAWLKLASDRALAIVRLEYTAGRTFLSP